MSDSDKYGLLLQPDIKLHRKYFNELVKLIGITVLYRSPKKDKHWTAYGEIDSNYNEEIPVGCIFREHPDQKTLKKMGWVSELVENACFIHVPYDLPGLQVGALFSVPSGLDNTENRLFRVVELSYSMVYPASITCEIVPEYSTNYDKALNDFSHESINVIQSEEFETLE